jgi:hypothetical protein
MTEQDTVAADPISIAAISTAEWKEVPGFAGLYEVCVTGQIRRVGRRELRPYCGRDGYYRVQLWRENKASMYLLHRLVAHAFLGTGLPGLEANHRDGDKSHNGVDNLEWVTRSQNLIHAYRLGLRAKTPPPPFRKRKPRIAVKCACGCGSELETPDRKGRDRRCLSGHHPRPEKR